MTISLLSARTAFALGLAAVMLEVLLITPWWDGIAERNEVAHFSQHGLIFLGGVLLGVALRDLFVQSRRTA
jgi:hypothetical protein